MALRQLDAVRGRCVCTCGTDGGERVTGRQADREGEGERAKVFVEIITLHEW